MQPAASKPTDTGKPPPLPPRPPGGALAAALRDALPARPAAAPPKQAAAHAPPAAMPPPSQRPSVDGTPHAPDELTPLLARAWDHLETTLRGLTSAVVGGRAIGEEMLAIIGPRLRALNEELAPLLQTAGRPPAAASAAEPGPAAENAAAPPTAAKPAAAPASAAAGTAPVPDAPDDIAAAADLLQALKETGERNAMDLVGAQPASGDAQPAHGHGGKTASEGHSPAVPDGASGHAGPAATPVAAKPASTPQPGARS
jgi:hypothetical protein